MGVTEESRDSFSDIDDLPAEINALAHELGKHERPAAASASPFRIGRYTVLKRIGSGGMGVVYAAYDDELDRKVAIKIVRRVDELDDPDSTARMRREAQALAKVSHPNVLAVHEVGLHDESLARGRAPVAAGRFVFIVMEFIVGKTLRAWWTERPRSWRELLDASLQAARGLAAVHKAGLVHRDVKPENVMISDDDHVHLMDFGLARARFDDRMESLDGLHSDPLATPAMSRSGAIVGTPAYMAPEQFDGPEVGPAADQFAWAVMTWEALFGERPFAGHTLAELRMQVTEGRRRDPPRTRAVPSYVRRALERALAVDPARRWPDLDALLTALARDRRRQTWWLALPVVATATAFVLVPRANAIDCDDRDAQLGAVWSEPQRQQVRDAMLATAVSYAADTADRVERALDAHADEWMALHTRTCAKPDPTLSPALHTAQALCLVDRKRALAALVHVLGDADAAIVERAVQATNALPAIAACEDPDYLAAEVKPPDDPEIAAQVDELRERLSRVNAMIAAGAYASAMPLAEAITADARKTQHAPVIAEALLRTGLLDEALAQFPEAERALRESYTLALASNDDRTAADAAVELVEVIGHRLARYDDGLEWGFVADAVVRRSGVATREAKRLEFLGTLYLERADHDAALAHYQRALAAWEAAVGPDRVELAAALDGLGRTHRARGEYDQALAALDRALAIREAQLSPDHPAVGGTHMAMASVYAMRVDNARSLEHSQRALDTYERAFGPDHPSVATALDGIGFIHQQNMHGELALPYHRRSLAIREQVLDANHPDLATSYNYLANAELLVEDQTHALPHFQRALAIYEHVFGPEHPRVAQSLVSIADLYLAKQEYAKARELYERGLAIKAKTIGPDHPSLGATEYEIGVTYKDEGKLDEALPHYRKSVEILERALGPDAVDVGNALLGLGLLQQERGDPEALAILERAHRLLAPSEVPAATLADCRWGLAQLVHDRDPTRARTLAEQAAEGFRATMPERASAIDAWLAKR
ncbi:MAG TPA: serine/threonine-protein kinase [Nannocystaceae bacterium]|nr:serine/threonine-protein kinase [Nannocystaceae bacterium]